LEKSIRAEDYDSPNGSLVFDIPEVSFEDIVGHKRAKEHLREIIKYLKEPQKLKKFGVKPPKGMLLYGPPGTGKTMLAKALAKEASLPFISVTGTDILNIEVMKSIFQKAHQYAPSVIFIDEINGFSDDPEELVFVIAATNFKEKIDNAILRSGRIDLHVEIPILDKESRGYFIDKMLSKPTEGMIDRNKLIMFTAGLSGADLEKINRQSSMEAIKQGKSGLTQDIIIEQINILKYGEKITSGLLDMALETTAYHEAGHAVISRLLMPDIKIEQIVVTPRNESLGMCVAYAGRISQIKKFDQNGLDSGAVNDLSIAMKYGYFAIAHLGMDTELGYININNLKLPDIEKKVQDRLSLLIKEMTNRTKKLVDENWESIEKIALILLEEEFIDGDRFYNIISHETVQKSVSN